MKISFGGNKQTNNKKTQWGFFFCLFIESWNIPRWKEPTKIIKSNSWLHTGPTKNQTIILRALSKNFLHSSGPPEEPFPNLHPTWPFPESYSMLFSVVLSLSCHEREGPSSAPLLPVHLPWGLPSAPLLSAEQSQRCQLLFTHTKYKMFAYFHCSLQHELELTGQYSEHFINCWSWEWFVTKSSIVL